MTNRSEPDALNLDGVAGLHPLDHLSEKIPTTSQSQFSAGGWQCVQTLKGHTSWVRALAISPDGQILVSGSGDKTVRIWLLQTGELRHVLKGHTAWVRSVAISPNGQTLASASNDKTICLWHLPTGELQRTLKGHTDWVRSIAFSP
ncbi:MAG: hypothetical protein MJA27_19320, partial [Pseudanabaenales cyanobacterium]|nr:hypothetical protein [Pseudanabaenales cyanobacterium]